MKKLILALSIVLSSIAFAAKSYQVTGVVVEVKADSIIVDKKGEKFEIAWPQGTKTTGGEVKKGDKITVYYTMSATEAEVKTDTKAEKKPTKKK